MFTAIGDGLTAIGDGLNRLTRRNTNQKDNTGDTEAQGNTEEVEQVDTPGDTEVAQGNPNVAQNMQSDNDIIEKITSNLNTLFDGINESNNKSKGHIDSIKVNLQRIQEALQNPELQKKVSELEEEIQTINTEKVRLNTELDKLKEAQKNLNADLISKDKINSEAITNKKRVNDLNNELNKQNKELNAKIEALQKELTEKNTEINGKLTQINELVTDNMGLKEDSKDVAKQLEELQGLYSDLLKRKHANQRKSSEEDTYNPPVKKTDLVSEQGYGSRQKPESRDNRSGIPNVKVNTWVGPEKGGRKTRHRGKSRKNKKTRKNKKQKKTTKK